MVGTCTYTYLYEEQKSFEYSSVSRRKILYNIEVKND